MNGEFGEGYSPLPLSDDGAARRSSAVGYLDASTRCRTNLRILGETQVRRILFAAGRIAVQLDRPGVGSNLMDHPAIHISGYLQPVARHKMLLRRNYTDLRWSSGLADVPGADMVMMAVCRSAWRSACASAHCLPISAAPTRLARCV
jgi:5-(hydroxymethyl)furfural/furfural oxidase